MGEKAISKNAEYSYYYANNVIKEIFSLGEQAIAKDVQFSFFYAKNVLKGKFPLGEKIILNSEFKNKYLALIEKSN